MGLSDLTASPGLYHSATKFLDGTSAVAAGLLPARGLRSHQRRYVRWLTFSDAVVVAAVVALAQTLRFGSVTGESLAYTNVDYAFVSAVIVVAWLVALASQRSRAAQVLDHGLEEYRRVWTATLSVFAVVAVISAMFQLEIARGFLALALPLGLAALTLNRMLGRRYVAARRRAGQFVSSVLAVGHPGSVRALARELSCHPQGGYRVVGVCVPEGAGVGLAAVDGIPAYQHRGDIVHAVLRSGADTVALTSGHLDPNEIRDLSWQLEKLDIDLVVSPGIVDVSGPRLMMRPVGGLPLIHVDKPQYEGAKRFHKRAFDLCLATAALTVAAPVMLAAALAIKLTSHGPVFYKAERIGLDGTPFTMIKFRSMVVDADQRLAQLAGRNDGNGVLFKLRHDPRVTPVGRWLRRYSIDELPQLINVLRREMSIVGPRPPLRNEVDCYDQQVRRRMLVPPGITGLWQVSGRSDLSWEDSVRLDLSYVENWSMVGDLVIIASTAKAVVLGSGAY
ncbi:sugar transferase [Mycobacterium sp. TNTM28]|uniref:Sugar transferase n=1 Tax=[Mycobacterium] fortunisiensis TaxID=2600579 RepID=A0ABS6KT52_9MYCO|nr:sugar transferase [[Mycobacterium] fortunisiensis]MBU9766753.1 sugar transferase [[Mycobacterium] fortunisiensis]